MLTTLRILIHDLFLIVTFTASLTPRHSTLDWTQVRHGCGPMVFEISHTTPG
jgi:hypothetical protein